jgi:hypothetical protein
MAASSNCKCTTVSAPYGGKRYKRKLCWGKSTAKRRGGIVSNKSCK